MPASLCALRIAHRSVLLGCVRLGRWLLAECRAVEGMRCSAALQSASIVRLLPAADVLILLNIVCCALPPVGCRTEPLERVPNAVMHELQQLFVRNIHVLAPMYARFFACS